MAQFDAPLCSQVQTEPNTHVEASAPEVKWRLGTRIAFRFAFAYFALYHATQCWGWLPYADSIVYAYDRRWHAVVPWVGQHVLRLSHPITVFSNGSGDTTYDYVQTLCYLIVAMAVALVWSLLDARRANYEKLHRWFTVYLRLSLAAAMMDYGSIKVINSQFPSPYLSRLFTANGDSTPMSLLWMFMGASTSYTVFAGAVEMLGGALLIVPRLNTLGALVCAAATGNVFILNMSYDVPVKLFSFHLLLTSGLLLLPDLRRLADFFVLNRKVEPAVQRPLFQRKWLNRGVLVFQLVFGVCMGSWFLHQSYQYAVTQGDLAPKPALYGIWVVHEFSAQGENQQAARWQRIFFDSYSEICVQAVSGKLERFIYQLDRANHTLTLWKRETPGAETELAVTRPSMGVMTLDGTVDDRQIHATLHRVEEPKFMLTNRGFHWINEYPFNRFDEHGPPNPERNKP